MKTGIKSIEISDFDEIRPELIQLEWITREFRIQCPGARIDSTDTIGHPMRMWEWGRILLLLKERFGYPFRTHSKAEKSKWEKSRINILDIGSAVSLIGPALSYLGCNVLEIDVDLGWQVERLKLKTFLNKHPWTGDFEWLQMGYGSISKLDQFDVVMAISTIEHVETSLELKAWKEMSEAVKPGGLLIVTMDSFKESKKGYIHDAVRYTNYDMELVKTRVDELKSYGLKPIGKEDYRWHGVHVEDGSFAFIAMSKE